MALKGKATIWPEEVGQAPVTAWFTEPRKVKYKETWTTLWQSPSGIGMSIAEQAMMEKPLTQTEYRVRDYLLSSLLIGNFTAIKQADIASKLRISRQAVSLAIKRLVQLNILQMDISPGGARIYRFNPAFCYCGGLGNGIKARKEAIAENTKGVAG